MSKKTECAVFKRIHSNIDQLMKHINEKLNHRKPDKEFILLRNKDYFTVNACYGAIYDNPLLNDKNIVNLYKLAQAEKGSKGVNDLISVGANTFKYSMFKLLRHKLGDERAVKVILNYGKHQEHQEKPYSSSDIPVLHHTHAKVSVDSDLANITGITQPIVVIQKMKTCEMQSVLQNIMKQYEIAESHQMQEANMPAYIGINSCGILDEKLHAQVVWFMQTGQMLQTLQNAVEHGVVNYTPSISYNVIHDTQNYDGSHNAVDELAKNNTCLPQTVNIAEELRFVDQKVLAQEEWYWRVGEILPTLAAATGLGAYAGTPEMYILTERTKIDQIVQDTAHLYDTHTVCVQYGKMQEHLQEYSPFSDVLHWGERIVGSLLLYMMVHITEEMSLNHGLVNQYQMRYNNI